MQAHVHVHHTRARAHHTRVRCVACVHDTAAWLTPLAPALAHLAVVLVLACYLFINHAVAVLGVVFLFLFDLRAFVCVLA